MDRHNEIRREVAKGQKSGEGEAANMRKLVWNNELETIAQRWADQCNYGHAEARELQTKVCKDFTNPTLSPG